MQQFTTDHTNDLFVDILTDCQCSRNEQWARRTTSMLIPSQYDTWHMRNEAEGGIHYLFDTAQIY